MKRKPKNMLICSIIVVFILIIYIIITINMQSRLYDKSKPNIFEIPETTNNYISVDSKRAYYDYYFMVQEHPIDNAIQVMIGEFIRENSELITSKFINSSSSVTFHFMKPSFRFPIYFEENKSYFNMDDYVENYLKTNEFVKVIFRDKPDNYEYIFYHDNY